MTATRSALALLAVCAASVTLVGCGGESATAPTSSSSPTSSAAPVQVMPTVAELNDVMARLIDPNLPIEEKVLLIEEGDKAGDFFDIVTKAAQEQEIRLEAIDPVMPSYQNSSVVVGTNVVIPEQDPRLVEGVEFLNVGGRWILAKDTACQLASAITPEPKPVFCLAPGETPPPPPPPEEPPAEAPPEAPAPEAPPAEPAPPAPPAEPAPPPPPPAPEDVPPPPPAPEGQPAPPPA